MKNTLKQEPLISVIMAVANGMPFLPFAVKSILNQHYKNFEFIIIDDFSKDASLQFLKSIKDKRVFVIKNKHNQGLAKSLNIAINKARGKYIARMDHDDISEKKRLITQASFLEANPHIDLCGSWVTLIDGKNKVIGIKKTPQVDEKIKKQLTWYSPIIHPTFMGKRDFFKKLHGYNNEYDFAEDYEILLRGKKDFKYANLPIPLLRWRIQSQRRSYKYIQKVNKADLKVKIKAIKLYGLNFEYLLALIKQFLTLYFLPSTLKLYISKLLKMP